MRHFNGSRCAEHSGTSYTKSNAPAALYKADFVCFVMDFSIIRKKGDTVNLGIPRGFPS